MEIWVRTAIQHLINIEIINKKVWSSYDLRHVTTYALKQFTIRNTLQANRTHRLVTIHGTQQASFRLRCRVRPLQHRHSSRCLKTPLLSHTQLDRLLRLCLRHRPRNHSGHLSSHHRVSKPLLEWRWRKCTPNKMQAVSCA